MFILTALFCNFLVLSVLLFNCANSKNIKLPEGFPICHRNDPNINECMKNAANKARDFLVAGVPELNIPSITPFVVPHIDIDQGTNAINLKASFDNVTFYGFETYSFTKFEFDVKTLSFYGEVDFGKLTFDAKYNISGKILVAPISGSGVLQCNITSSHGNFTQHNKLITKKGLTYIDPVDIKMNLKFGKTVSRLDGLFGNSDETLAKATNNVINENSEELIKEMTPAIEQVMSKVFEDMMRKSTGRIPYDIIYPLLK